MLGEAGNSGVSAVGAQLEREARGLCHGARPRAGAAWCWPSSRAEARVAFRGPMRRGPRPRKEPRLPCPGIESAGEGGRRARAAPLTTPQTRERGAGAGRRGMNNRGTRQLTRNLEGESAGGRDG